MFPRELVWNHFRSTWGESAILLLTIGAAVAVVVFQQTLTGPTEEEVHGLAHRLGKNMLLTPASTEPERNYALDFSEASFPESYLARLKNSDLATHVRVLDGSLKANVSVGETELILVGSAAARLGAGTQPAPALLGPAAAAALGIGPGDFLKVSGTELRIAGLIDPAPDGIDLGVFTSTQTAQAILGRPGQINEARLGGCWCSLDVPELGRKVEALLPQVRATTIAGMLEAQKTTVATVKQYSKTTLMAGAGVASSVVLLLLGASVRRERRMLALLSVAGASRGALAAWVLLRAAVLGAISGGLGWYLGGTLAVHLAPRFFGLTTPFPAELLWPALLLASLAATIGAFWPAFVAARLDPTVSLKEE